MSVGNELVTKVPHWAYECRQGLDIPYLRNLRANFGLSIQGSAAALVHGIS